MLLPVDVVESQFDNYLLSCKYLKSRVFRGAIVVMSSSQWLFATWISMFPQLRTEREIFAAKNCFLFCYHLHLATQPTGRDGFYSHRNNLLANILQKIMRGHKTFFMISNQFSASALEFQISVQGPVNSSE